MRSFDISLLDVEFAAEYVGVGALVLLGVGFVLSSVALLRARVLPRWSGWLLLLAPPVLLGANILAPTATEQRGALLSAVMLILNFSAPLAMILMGCVLWSTNPQRSQRVPLYTEIFGSRLWRRTGFSNKSLWDWMDLSAKASIPIVIAVGGLLFNSAQNERNKEVDQRRGQDEALQAYLSEMSDLLGDEGFRKYLLAGQDALDSQSYAQAQLQRTVAQARTLTVLKRLNAEPEPTKTGLDKENPGIRSHANRLGSAERKGRIVEFLYKADLITDKKSVIALSDADLEDTNLSNIDLSSANLSSANLRHADLDKAILNNANLSKATLRNACLGGAKMKNANLSNASLTDTDLRHADLSEATGLTQSAINSAFGDDSTNLPEGVQQPKDWSLPIDEQERKKEINPLEDSWPNLACRYL